MAKDKFVSQGIDISHWNPVQDFNKVKESGIDFVIIKAGGSDKGFYTDRQFENNYRLARLAGLKVGAYYYVGPNFCGHYSGVLDAQRFIRIIKGKEFDMPVYVDIESTSPAHKAIVTDAALAFCDQMGVNGYYIGIYGSDISTFKDRLELDRLRTYDKWVAKYSKTKPSYVKIYGMWQKSSSGSVSGITGPVDLDECYVDYQKIMRENNLNRG